MCKYYYDIIAVVDEKNREVFKNDRLLRVIWGEM